MAEPRHTHDVSLDTCDEALIRTLAEREQMTPEQVIERLITTGLRRIVDQALDLQAARHDRPH